MAGLSVPCLLIDAMKYQMVCPLADNVIKALDKVSDLDVRCDVDSPLLDGVFGNLSFLVSFRKPLFNLLPDGHGEFICE